MSEQNTLNINETSTLDSVEKYRFEPIKGYPMLQWKGKRPFSSTQYYPAQKKEAYGEDVNGWINKIFWGDNLQVMSHLLREYKGRVDLIYIDPPYDSKADYKKKIRVKGEKVSNDTNSFEEKQYSDIWTNDEYLQFMYERLILLRELLSHKGAIYLHCDWHKSHHLRCLMDEIFGADYFRNEIIWHYRTGNISTKQFQRKHDNILFYTKSEDHYFKVQQVKEYYFCLYGSSFKPSFLGPNDGEDENGLYKINDVDDVWNISAVFTLSNEHIPYPTQKPEALLERIINASSQPGDLIFDGFAGTGTTLSVAMKLGRRFIGADINLGAIQITTKRLANLLDNLAEDPDSKSKEKHTGFEVYNVNNYDVFRNHLEAKDLLLEALEVEPLSGTIYDGEKDGYMVKVMPVNRIATREDLNQLISNFPYKVFEKRKEEAPNKPVESILLICMGHETDLKAHLEQESGYKLNVQVVDILRDKADIQFKRDSEANISVTNDRLEVINFYPMNLLQKLSLQKESVNEWRELVESVMIDWNFDGAVMEPKVIDIPSKKEFVSGSYDIPSDAGTIKIKITDLLSESYEEVIHHG